MKGKILAALLAACTLTLTGCAQGSAKDSAADLKIQGIGSVAVIGDSISTASATCGYNSTCSENSWATGSNALVNSHATRIAAEQGGSVVTYNDAVAGAKVADLAPQVSLAVQQKPDYVAVEIGANDYCAASIGQMTSPTAYRQQLASVLASFSNYLPNADIFIASVPDPLGVYEVNKSSAAAKQVWAYAGLCQSLLADPADSSADATERRQLVQQRAQAYNGAIEAVCAEYVRCHYDGGAAYAQRYSAADISTLDYFHPSLSGQQKLAAATWDKGGVRDWLRQVSNPVTSVIVPSAS